MSSPSDAQPPVGPADDRPPSTQEIPVAAPAGATAVTKSLPPHPDAAPPVPVAPIPVAPIPVAAAQPTGPVDFVPGLPGLGTPPVPPPVPSQATGTLPPPTAPPVPEGTAAPASPSPSWPDTLESQAAAPTKRRLAAARGALDRTALTGVGLAGLALVLVLLGVSLDFGGESFWSGLPLWSAFATLCALLGLLAFAASYSMGGRLRSGTASRVALGALVGLAVFWLLVVLPRVDSDRGFVLTAALACLGGALWIGPRTRP